MRILSISLNVIELKYLEYMLYILIFIYKESFYNTLGILNTRCKDLRNFVIVQKIKKEVHIRVLDVEDEDNVLTFINANVGNYKPLYKGYNAHKEEDIEIIMLYIIKSFKLLEYKPFGIQR